MCKNYLHYLHPLLKMAVLAPPTSPFQGSQQRHLPASMSARIAVRSQESDTPHRPNSWKSKITSKITHFTADLLFLQQLLKIV